MHYYSLKDEEKSKYFKHKTRLDKKFVWTEKAIKKLYTLDDNLSQMQKQLEKEVVSAYELFSKLEKNGMPFLHGFKVIGKITFEKYISCNSTIEQENLIDKWDDIAYYSYDEIEAWQLIFDSEIKDFMPLSKIRLAERRQCFNINFQYAYQYKRTFCSYLAHFLNYNTTFSFKDLVSCTIKDFSPCVTVVLNYEVSELRRFSNLPQHQYDENDPIYNMLNDRQNSLNQTFDWNEKNVQKIMDVNSWIWKRSNELKQYIYELNSVFNIFCETDPSFSNFHIEGQIEYHSNEANDITTQELQKEMRQNAAFNYSNLMVDECRQKINDSSNEDESLNWNFEVYRYHLNEEQLKVRFHYFVHAIFVDDHIYSFEDLVRMREEDFKVCLEINWSGD